MKLLNKIESSIFKHKKKKVSKKIIRQYPFLQIKDKNNQPIKVLGTWDDFLLVGWKSAFGSQLWKDLNDILVKEDYVDKFIITELNEINGVFSINYLPVPEKLGKKLDKWEELYRGKSMLQCCYCGHPTTQRANTSYVCDVCAKNYNCTVDLTWDDIPIKPVCADWTDPYATTKIEEHPLSDQMKSQWKKTNTKITIEFAGAKSKKNQNKTSKKGQ